MEMFQNLHFCPIVNFSIETGTTRISSHLFSLRYVLPDERRADELEDVISVPEGVHHLFDHLILVKLRVQLLPSRVSLRVLQMGS